MSADCRCRPDLWNTRGRAAASTAEGRQADRRSRSGGNLRTIAYDGIEVLRAVSYLVRDRDWGTYAPEIADLKIEQRDDAFAVSYRRALSRAGCDRAYDNRPHFGGKPVRALIFEAEGTSRKAASRPTAAASASFIQSWALPARRSWSSMSDGEREETRFPDLIEPWQPFKDMRRHHPYRDRRVLPPSAGWREISSRWRTSGTGRMRPTRPMSALSRCPGPIGYRPASLLANGSFSNRRRPDPMTAGAATVCAAVELDQGSTARPDASDWAYRDAGGSGGCPRRDHSACRHRSAGIALPFRPRSWA